MQQTYFATFFLGTPEKSKAIRIPEVAAVVDSWIFNNPHRPIAKPKGYSLLQDAQFDIGNRASVSVRHIGKATDSKGGEVWGLRYEHRDDQDQNRIWRTDAVVDGTESEQRETRCSISVSVGSTRDTVVPLGDVASRPRIVPTLIHTFGAYEAFPLRSDPIQIREQDVELFIQLLESGERNLPVVFVSGRLSDDQPIVDTVHLADQLAGLAYVCVSDSKRVTLAIRDLIGNDLNAFDGAVRVYWPSFTTTDSRYRHKLWLRQRVEAVEQIGAGFAKQLLRTLSRLSSSRHVPGIVRWEDLQRRRLALSANRATDAEEFKDLLELVSYENDELTKQVEALRSELEEARTVAEIKETESEQWRLAYEEVRRTPTIASKPHEGEDVEFASVEKAVECAKSRYSEELIITGGATRKAAYQYDDPQRIFRGLKWLATTYREAKLGKTPGIDLDLSCKTETELWFKANQSAITMKQFPGDYKVVRNGKVHWLEEHIGKGTGTDPRTSIRIAFYFDEDDGKVVVGFLGQHQQTTASN